MISLRKLVLAWMIAWLPLSGAMAAVMPFSGVQGVAPSSGLSVLPAAIAATDPAGADEVASLPCHGGAAANTNPPGTCTHCLLCDLAVSLMLPCIPELKGLTPSRSFARIHLFPYPSFVPELTPPPPRAAVS